MPNDDSSAEKEALIQGFVEGCLTPAESARLHQLVREDPLLARVITQSLRMDGAIRELVGEKEPLPEESEAPPRRATRQTRITRLKQIHGPGGARPLFPFIAVFAAACLLLVIVVVFNSFKKPPGADSAQRAPRRDEEALRAKLKEAEREAEGKLRDAEDRLLEFERTRGALKPPPQSAPDPAVIEKLNREREKIHRELQESSERARKAREALDQIPEKPVDEPPVPPEEPPKIENKPSPGPLTPTRAAVAKAERVEGEVHLVTDGARTPLTGTRDLLARQGIETAQAPGRATVSFGDKTRMTLDPETSIREVRVEGGKRAFLDRGTVGAVVSRQPSAQPMTFVTPHGEAVVVGTALRLTVVPGAKGFTRLEVTAGKVRLKNTAGKSADVTVGFQAVAAEGVAEVLVTRIPKSLAEILLEDSGAVGINFGPDGLKLPEGFLPESGQVFDPQRGYGWEKAMGSAMSPGNPSDVLRGSYTAGGGAQETVTWRMRVPNGTYIVSACVGGPGSGVPDQGPHHVVVEGKPVVNAEITHNSRTIERFGVVTVSDGELTVVLGGYKSPAGTSDGTQDTVVNFITIKRARSSGRK